MRLYSDNSMIYEGMTNSLIFVEGRADSTINSYIKENKERIVATLRHRGVDVGKFDFISPARLDTNTIRQLILRQQPTLSIKEAEEKATELWNIYETEGKSRLTFVGDIGYDIDGCCGAKIFCEEDFGTSATEAMFKLESFIDIIATYHIQQGQSPLLSGIRYKLPDSYEHDALREQDNYDCLCDDILAESIYGSTRVEISPILFDDDFNISLPLYPHVTISLNPLPKTLYILFLQHPEGILLKDIHLYEDELKKIYSHVSGRKNTTVINRMFNSLVDPTENPLHKNLSIIRRSFTSQLNYNIARNYIPTHGRTKAHNVPLESEYIIMPDFE